VPVVPKDLSVVKREVCWQVIEGEITHFSGVVARGEIIPAPPDVDDREGVVTRISVGVAVYPEQIREQDGDARFFPNLTTRGVLSRLPVVDEAARQRPALGLVEPLNQQNAPIASLHDDIHRGEGIPGRVRRRHP
jgi:hypothetical protein